MDPTPNPIDIDYYHHLLEGIWQRQAACATPHPEANWFPTQGQAHTQATLNAINVCHSCPVEPECLNYSIVFDGHRDRGIWGGLTHKQRIALRSRLYREGTLPIYRVCSNPTCTKPFRVASVKVKKTGICCSNACRLARRRRMQRPVPETRQAA